MYSHSPERNRVDVVDLDPYGTASPFVDAAVQCITDGGMPLPTNSRRFRPQVYRGETRPFMRDLYGPLGLGHQQLSGEMVGLALQCITFSDTKQTTVTPIMAGFQSRPNTLMKR